MPKTETKKLYLFTIIIICIFFMSIMRFNGERVSVGFDGEKTFSAKRFTRASRVSPSRARWLYGKL